MFDVIVIGGGPAGVTAALRARELGATVALVERGRLGGTCTNDGCVPTRVLARAARLVRDAEQFADYGLEGAPPTVDFARLLERTRQIVDQVQGKKQLRARLEPAGRRGRSRSGRWWPRSAGSATWRTSTWPPRAWRASAATSPPTTRCARAPRTSSRRGT